MLSCTRRPAITNLLPNVCNQQASRALFHWFIVVHVVGPHETPQPACCSTSSYALDAPQTNSHCPNCYTTCLTSCSTAFFNGVNTCITTQQESVNCCNFTESLNNVNICTFVVIQISLQGDGHPEADSPFCVWPAINLLATVWTKTEYADRYANKKDSRIEHWHQGHTKQRILPTINWCAPQHISLLNASSGQRILGTLQAGCPSMWKNRGSHPLYLECLGRKRMPAR